MSKNQDAIGMFSVHAFNVRIASTPMFYPKGYDGKTKDNLKFSVIANEGTGKAADGTEVAYKTTIPVSVWGDLASAMAHMLDVGKQVNIIGRLTNYLKPTGQVINGKPHQENLVTLTATRIILLADPKKNMAKLLGKNVVRLIQAGNIRAEEAGILTYDNLFMREATNITPFNPAEAMITGKHGNAEIWTKDRGTWSKAPGFVASNTVVQGTSAGVNMSDPAIFAQFMAFKAMMDNKPATVEPVIKEATTAEPIVQLGEEMATGGESAPEMF